jgi:regulator of protease activity HflC (stomatin/prohibitin superfamily)
MGILSTAPTRLAISSLEVHMGADSPAPLGIGRALRVLAVAWAALFLTRLLTSFILPAMRPVATLLLVGGTVYVVCLLFQLLSAKGRVLAAQEVPLWHGSAKLVSWNPNEGVLFLKNKQIDFVDNNPHDGGGIRVVYQHLGEELALRVPLEIQTLSFTDTEVLTREYMPLTIQGTLYWKVVDLSLFYLLISKEVHSASDRGTHSIGVTGPRPQFEAAESWLRLMAEERTRTIVSRVGTGLLIADRLASELPQALPGAGTLLGGGRESPAGYRSATDNLANTLKADLEAGVREYGLEIHRVALQEVKLPAEIYAAAVGACRSAYLPLKAQAEALARKLQLQAEVDVIGRDAVGMKEIAASIPALAFQEFLAPLFLDLNKKRAAGSQ